MRRLGALAIAALIVVLLAVAQLVLPGIAAQNVRDRLSRSGRVLELRISAFPAIELLWHQADTVVVRMASYRASPTELPDTLHQVADAGSLRASAQVFRDGLLTLHNASLIKQGNRLTGSATADESDLRRALPILRSLTPVASGNGELVLRGTVFGVSLDATVRITDGKLVVTPDVPFGSFATITLFSDSQIEVTGISAATAPGGFTVRGTAALH